MINTNSSAIAQIRQAKVVKILGQNANSKFAYLITDAPVSQKSVCKFTKADGNTVSFFITNTIVGNESSKSLKGLNFTRLPMEAVTKRLAQVDSNESKELVEIA
jgi:hypothetical protein